MPQRILGIDIGSWSAKAVLVESSFRGFKVEEVHEVPIGAGDDSTKTQRQIAALELLLEYGALRADTTVASLPGEYATTRFIELPFSDPKKVDLTIGGELADVLPFDLMDAVYDHTILDKRDDGSSLSLCIAAQSTKVSDYLALLQSAKVDPRYLPADVIQLFSLYQNFLKADASKAEAPKEASTEASTFILPTPGGPPDARLVVDIGHERTLVCAAGENGIAYTRVIRAGGGDVTQAIAQAYELEWEDAEDGKHEDALVASARHPAPSDAAARMSEVVASGLRPLVKELRRTLQAIRSEKRVRVARIDLIGGGARIRNLANYLAEQLNVPVANGVAVEQIVERNVEGPRRPAYALALANAIRTTAEDSATRMDLRMGEFAFAGTLENVRRRVPFIAGAIAVCSVLTLVNVFAQYHTVSAREAEIDQEFCAITKKVVGREICEPTVAISVVREPASELGAFKLPERSAYAVVAELSSLTPKDVDVTFEEMEVTPDRVRISGETVSFDAVDKLVSAYSANSCYSDIKKGKLSKKGDGAGVDFQLSIKLRCS